MYNPTLINKQREEPYQTGADSFKLVIPKGVKTHLLLIHLKALQNGATKPTLSDFLAQIASTITISVGNTTIMKLTPAEYAEYLIRKLDIIGLGVVNEATGADNDVSHFTLPIVFCPLDKSAVKYGKLPLLQKDYGLDGAKEVSVLIEYPANANELDGRVLTVYSIALDKETPSKVVEWKSTVTPALSVGEDQKLALSQDPSKQLYEIFLKQTSYLSEGDNTDTRTIQTISYQEGNETKYFKETRIEDFCNPIYISESETTGALRHDDQYQIIPFYDSNDAETSIALKVNSALSANVGVAEAITYVQRLISKLSSIGSL